VNWTFISGLAAVVAVIVAGLQWLTAQTRLALEIHATRYSIYKDLRDVVTGFMQNINFSNELQAKFLDAQSRARFHFGAEVEEYLEKLRLDMIRGHFFDRYGGPRCLQLRSMSMSKSHGSTDLMLFSMKSIVCSCRTCASTSACPCGGGHQWSPRSRITHSMRERAG
jgi:hypothetical protein